MNSTTTISLCAARDFRCPACGRVVLNPFEAGVEGRYHPECVRPPAAPVIDWPPRQDMPIFPTNPYTPNDYPTYPMYPGMTWHLNSCL